VLGYRQGKGFQIADFIFQIEAVSIGVDPCVIVHFVEVCVNSWLSGRLRFRLVRSGVGFGFPVGYSVRGWKPAVKPQAKYVLGRGLSLFAAE